MVIGYRGDLFDSSFRAPFHEKLLWEVKDVMLDTRWDWDRMPFVFPSEIQLMLQATSMPLVGRGRDKLAWVNNPKGDFNLKSAYKLAMGTDTNVAFSANWIWKSMILPCIKTFLWQCVHDSISMKTYLKQRGMINDDCCPICQEEAETILHALRDCVWVKTIWRQPQTMIFGCQICRIG